MNPHTLIRPFRACLHRASLAGLACMTVATTPFTAAAEVMSSMHLVSAEERSRHFEAVSRQLELGGTLFGYVDIEGDVLDLANNINGLLGRIVAETPAAAMWPQDFAELFVLLGFDDVKAIGFSSVALADGTFRNRTFLYTPEGRRGLLAGFGGPAVPYRHLRLAPADADLFFEAEVDLPAIYAAIRAVITKVAGEELAQTVDAQLQQAGAQAGVSAFDLIQRAKGSVATVLRFDDGPPVAAPDGSMVFPGFSVLVRLDGIGPGLTPVLDAVPIFEKTTDASRTIYTLAAPVPIEGWAPVLVAEGDALYVATTRGFFDTCAKQTAHLGTQPALRQALSVVGAEGNGLTYISPRFFSKLRSLFELNADRLNPEQEQLIGLVLSRLPVIESPMIAARVNRPDGILFTSHWNASLKQDLALLALYNPMSVGMVSAMAIPAFKKVRMQSQEKTIQNNLRQLHSAAEQYYLENAVETATYDDLVGPSGYIRELESVLGEDYTQIEFRSGEPVRVMTPDGREYSYPEEPW